MTDPTETDLLDPHRLDLRSADVVEPRVEELRKLFPEAVKDGKLDVEALQTALGDVAELGMERFGLTWPGKAEAIRMAQRRAEGTLLPMKDESVAWDTTRNVMVEGENLEVLKLLQRSYHGKVKLIYIDPPYNTGKDFVYSDNFREPLQQYLRYSGQVDENGGRLRANTETGGRYHSAWLSMMWPRLHLARSLLRDDGVLATTIDSAESARLRLLLDEIFGEENFVAEVAWQRKYTRSNDAGHFSETHDQLLIVARDVGQLAPPLEPRSDKQDSAYRNPDSDPRGPWKATPLHAKSGRAQDVKEVRFANGVRWTPPPGTYPRFSADRLLELEASGQLWFGREGSAMPSRKTYLAEVKPGLTPTTFWSHEEAGSTHEGNSDLRKLDLDGEFPNPKPVKLMRRLLDLFTGPSDLVLDFFAGSGTMGEAVLRANSHDEGRRQVLLVQFPEPMQDEDGKYTSIVDLARGRVRAVADEIGAGGFRSYHLTTAGLTQHAPAEDGTAVPLFVDSVNPSRSDEALLAEVLLARGFDLTEQVAWREVAGTSVADVADGALLVCFTREMTLELFEALVEREPAQLILLEAGFGPNDDVKINALQHLKTRNEHRQTPIELLVV